jgi:DNA topoisomerase-1
MTALPAQAAAAESELPVDPIDSALEAGLVYVTDAERGIRRRRRGRGFSYGSDDAGRPVRDEPTLERIRALAIPPAWTDVWICADPLGHLQATGRDAKGRKQYRYHQRWREVRDANKFALLGAFGHRLPGLRDRIDIELRRPALPRAKVLALVVRLLDETLVRVGNKEYAHDNESYGLTTITPDHVDIGWRDTTFDFVGKGGLEHHITVEDPRVTRIIRRCHELGGQALFSYQDEDGSGVSSITSTDVNDYLRDVADAAVTAKEFRTWGGTVAVAEHLAPLDPPETERDAEAAVIDAIDAAAEQLRNTRAVCRNCYIHPAIPDAYRDGSLTEQWKTSRSVGQLSRAERAVLGVLDAQI